MGWRSRRAEASFELLVKRHKASYHARPSNCAITTVLVEQRGGRRASRRGHRQGGGRRRGACTPPPTATAPSTPLTAPCAKASAPSTRSWTRSTWWTTRSAYWTARSHRRPDARHHRLVERAAGVVDDGQRHEHNRGFVPGPVRLARIRDLEDGAEVRRRDERHFTVAAQPNGPVSNARPARSSSLTEGLR